MSKIREPGQALQIVSILSVNLRATGRTFDLLESLAVQFCNDVMLFFQALEASRERYGHL